MTISTAGRAIATGAATVGRRRATCRPKSSATKSSTRYGTLARRCELRQRLDAEPRVPAGWTPYRDGHWTWIDPWGWTWVDDAPWGYAVSHYGRWAHVERHLGLGARVRGANARSTRRRWSRSSAASNFQRSLVVGGAHVAAIVGWFPLAPREVYRPSYPVSRGYFERINRSNAVIAPTTITNVYNTNVPTSTTRPTSTNVVYANQRVPGAVVAVPTAGLRAVAAGGQGRGARCRARRSPRAGGALSRRSRRYSRACRAAPRAAVAKPPVRERTAVVARTAPPPPPVPFAAQQQQLAGQAGHADRRGAARATEAGACGGLGPPGEGRGGGAGSEGGGPAASVGAGRPVAGGAPRRPRPGRQRAGAPARRREDRGRCGERPGGHGRYGEG